jgi:hypothetical protein
MHTSPRPQSSPVRTFWFKILSNLAAVGVGLVLSLLLLEGILRLLPVNEPFLRTDSVTETDPILRFQSNGDFIFSRGWDFAIVNRVHTNNAGFLNDQDYVADDPRPLVAVVGDSYVEAAMVPYAQTIQGRLAKALAPDIRVYSFGASGAPLSQYLAYANYVRERFHSKGFVFVIIANDFDESMSEYKQAPGFHYFFQNPDGSRSLRLVEFHPVHPTPLHALGSRLGLGKLALVRYLRTNLPSLEFRISRWLSKDTTRYVGQTAASTDKTRMRLSREAATLFLDRVETACGVPAQDILFVVDGIRPQLYDAAERKAAQNSYWALIRTFFIQQAAERGFATVDMQPIFLDHYLRDGKHFEFPTDAHWNGYGHELAAQQTLQSAPIKALQRALKPKGE